MNNSDQLVLNEVSTVYGQNRMLEKVSIRVAPGECVSLLGSNGAGKSTVIKAILGLVTIVEGEILFEGEEITGNRTYGTIRSGISIVPEGKRVFPKMTVYENLLMGAFKEAKSVNLDERFEKVFGHFPRLAERKQQLAGTLSGGEQSMLTIGRGLMGDPKLMIFDEPSLGLAPVLVQQTFEIIRKINEGGTTVFLVEQNAYMTLEISHRGYFLQKGQIIAGGTPEELKRMDTIRKAYFGEA